MIHDPEAHHLLAPQDIPRHLHDDHGLDPVVDQIHQAWALVFLTAKGIEVEGDPTVNVAHAWHEWIHDQEEK